MPGSNGISLLLRFDGIPKSARPFAASEPRARLYSHRRSLKADSRASRGRQPTEDTIQARVRGWQEGMSVTAVLTQVGALREEVTQLHARTQVYTTTTDIQLGKHKHIHAAALRVV